MIITKTPYRISFFGGGSDYPEWFSKNYGEVISTTVDKYIYITCRELPNFFSHKYRVVYSNIELVKNINKIKHNAVKNILLKSNISKGLEIHYDGDLPSRSGMGSSSCFVVGLLNAINVLQNKKISKKALAKKSIYLERDIMKENVGLQDQIAASYGGFNNISFNRRGFEVRKIKCSSKFKSQLNKNLILVYTGVARTAEKIANTYTGQLKLNKSKNIKEILSIVDQAKKIIIKGNADDFGDLLNKTWYQKRQLSKSVSTSKIDEMYNLGIKNGALGGKLLGAGGGGFILFYIKKNHHEKIKRVFNKSVVLPIELTEKGSEVIFNEK